MRDVIEAALRILCGATARPRVDGLVEITFCGATQLIEQYRFDQKVAGIVRETNAAFMLPQGIAPPLDGEAIIRLTSFLNTAFSKALTDDPRQRIKVAFYTTRVGGSPYWRCSEPARVLNELYPDTVYADVTADLDYYRLLDFDVIVVQGGFAGEGSADIHSVLSRLVRAGKKVVYEIDDDLDSLPRTNEHFFSLDPSTRRLEQWLKNESAAIFTTTEILADKLGHRDKTFVLPNSLDLARFESVPRSAARDDVIFVLWHGGKSHEIDLNWLHRDLYDFIVNRRPKLEKEIGKSIVVVTMGYLPTGLEKLLERGVKFSRDPKLKTPESVFVISGGYEFRFIRAIPVASFHEHLIALQPDICLCPLEPKTVFNQMKSSIKWQESTLAGAACVVTEPLRGDSGSVPGPFSTVPDDCVVKTTTAADMIQRLQELIKNPDKRQRLVEASTAHLRANYDLRVNARLWAEALAKITGRSVESEREAAVNGD
jgi:hypothetical protein